MAWFMLFLGTSSLFGAAGHSMQMQLGDVFFKTVLFMMNALSLFSIYFCFLSAYTFLNRDKELDRKYIYAVRIWVLVLLVASALQGNFTIIKIHAGIVLLFSMIAHYIVYRRSDDKGSSLVVTGILISFLPIIIHTLKISIDEWFNYKDISHVIMIISLIVIYKGASMSSEKMPRVQVTN